MLSKGLLEGGLSDEDNSPELICHLVKEPRNWIVHKAEFSGISFCLFLDASFGLLVGIISV
jgi:hypothetical protein